MHYIIINSLLRKVTVRSLCCSLTLTLGVMVQQIMLYLFLIHHTVFSSWG